MSSTQGASARPILLSVSLAVVVVFAFSPFVQPVEAGCGNFITTEERNCSPSCGGGTVKIGVCQSSGGACKNYYDAAPCPGTCTMFQAGPCLQTKVKPPSSPAGVQQASLEPPGTGLQQASCSKQGPNLRAKATIKTAAGSADSKQASSPPVKASVKPAAGGAKP